MIKDLNYLPFYDLVARVTDLSKSYTFSEARDIAVNQELIEKYPSITSWLPSQLLAKIAEWNLVWKDGKIDGNATIKENCTNDKNKALWLLATCSRSLISSSRRLYEDKHYGPLVPLILAAFKKYHDIPYSSWSNVSQVVDARMAEALAVTNVPNFSTDEILELRTLGLRYNSGKHAGTVRKPETTYGLNKTKNPSFDSLPVYVKMMVCQTWAAHPINRSEWMILDPSNWDNMPEPLISTEVLKQEKLPWD